MSGSRAISIETSNIFNDSVFIIIIIIIIIRGHLDETMVSTRSISDNLDKTRKIFVFLLVFLHARSRMHYFFVDFLKVLYFFSWLVRDFDARSVAA